MKSLSFLLGLTLVLTTKFVLAAPTADNSATKPILTAIPEQDLFPQELSMTDFYKALASGKMTSSELRNQIKKIEDLIVAGRGGIDTGGGTLIRSGTTTGLLDLFLYNKDAFFDSKKNSKNLTKTRSFKTFGVERVDNRNNDIVANAIAQIKKWEPSSPIFTKILITALKDLPLFYHDGSMANAPLEYHIPTGINVNQSDLKMIALYTNDFGVHMGYQDLEQISETNQVATFIHESLRLITVNKVLLLSNDEIQKITALLLSTPNPGQTLDRIDFLRGPTLAQIYQENAVYMEFYEIRNTICSTPNALGNNPTYNQGELTFCADRGSAIVDLKAAMDAAHKMNIALIYVNRDALTNEQFDVFAQRVHAFDLFISRARNVRLGALVNEFQQVTPLLDMLKNLLSLNALINMVNDGEMSGRKLRDAKEQLVRVWNAFEIKVKK